MASLRRIRPSTVATAAVLYVAAAWLRLQILHSPPYGDEPMHFTVAKYFGAPPPNWHDLYGLTWEYPSHIFWQRPLYYVAMHPFTLVSFDAFRLAQIAFCSLLHVAAFGLLMSRGVHRWIAAAAAGFLAALPLVLSYSVIGYMDAPMTTLILFSMWAADARRPMASGAFLLAACWTKETAIVFLPAFFLASFLEHRRRDDTSLMPIRLDRQLSAMLYAAVLAPLPIMLSFLRGLQAPGARAPDYALRLIEEMWIAPILLLILLAGLVWKRSRVLVWPALYVGLFYLALHVVFHRAVENYYQVITVVFTVVGVAATMDELFRRSHAAVSIRRWSLRAAPIVMGLFLVLSITVSAEAVGHVFRPINGGSQGTPWAAIDYHNHHRDYERTRAIEDVLSANPERVVVLDMEFTQPLYPLAEMVDDVTHLESGWSFVFNYNMHDVANATESADRVLVMKRADSPLGNAFQTTYEDCMVERLGDFTIYGPQACQGRADELEQANAEEEAAWWAAHPL